jgi:F-type H+-transporting ATPase subunit delta
MLSDLCQLLEASNGMKSFLGLLLGKNRIAYLPQISQRYRKFADDRFGVMRAKITAAGDLSSERAEAIKQGLEKQTGKQVVLSVETDASLIGGLRAEMGGKLFDGSVKTQLKRVAETLAKG